MYNEFENFCVTNNIYITYKVLPTGIKGFAFCYGDKYLVIVNCIENIEQQKKTTIHELIHILENHFVLNENDLIECEKETRNLLYNLNKFELDVFENAIKLR